MRRETLLQLGWCIRQTARTASPCEQKSVPLCRGFARELARSALQGMGADPPRTKNDEAKCSPSRLRNGSSPSARIWLPCEDLEDLHAKLQCFSRHCNGDDQPSRPAQLDLLNRRSPSLCSFSLCLMTFYNCRPMRTRRFVFARHASLSARSAEAFDRSTLTFGWQMACRDATRWCLICASQARGLPPSAFHSRLPRASRSSSTSGSKSARYDALCLSRPLGRHGIARVLRLSLAPQSIVAMGLTLLHDLG